MMGLSAEERSHRSGVDRGFTLIELLVVILIIGFLVGMISVAVGIATKKAKVANAKSDIVRIGASLEAYKSDEGRLPGFDKVWDEEDLYFNAFPDAFEALLGERHTKEKGAKGGRNAPYFEPNAEDIVVLTDPSAPPAIVDGKEFWATTPASKDERWNPDVPKYLLDPWGAPYFYRENESKKRKGWMHKPKSFDLWSAGPNRKNESMFEVNKDAEYDDVSNF
ncbi:MAG: prepilin-type N-terminal cleavage/methylation domain-containing protein [Planctomycetota bacterium]